ncbi:hypothetical protein FHS43_002345 [Streptosporangium becharense]|uniref:Uncharacterized protein n=1 Tax=Streptosporangium becharense TaxID=1816182 RepID=A0A7W9MI58_9ACTN|nr:hypothetical protein [Streptosporangium becharense]MBB2911080.1 hypothetical protein [Streptosporangium becharense]MBB5821862.1 hypothetical protein [Streptosporangium becharense]
MVTASRRRVGPKCVRDAQRLAHLVAGFAVVAYVYLTPPPGSPAQFMIRWVLIPALILSGVALWQWPKIRRSLRRRGGRA